MTHFPGAAPGNPRKVNLDKMSNNVSCLDGVDASIAQLPYSLLPRRHSKGSALHDLEYVLLQRSKTRPCNVRDVSQSWKKSHPLRNGS